jgi:ribonucleoside-diphosphate reductase alpha chain
MLFRYGIPLEEIILQLDKSTYSLVDAAGILKRILSKYVSIDYEENEDGEIIGEKCPECGQNSYIKENGCGKCLNCGTSSCG